MTLQLVTESNYIKQVYANISEKLLTNSYGVDVVPTYSNNIKIPVIHLTVEFIPLGSKFGHNPGKQTAIINVNCLGGTKAIAGDLAQSCLNIVLNNDSAFSAVNMERIGYPKVFDRSTEINKNVVAIKTLVYQFVI